MPTLRQGLLLHEYIGVFNLLRKAGGLPAAPPLTVHHGATALSHPQDTGKASTLGGASSYLDEAGLLDELQVWGHMLAVSKAVYDSAYACVIQTVSLAHLVRVITSALSFTFNALGQGLGSTRHIPFLSHCKWSIIFKRIDSAF